MFIPALKLVVRLLPFTAALVASVAIGASTQAPATANTNSAALQPAPMVASQSFRNAATGPLAVAGPDLPLLTQADTSDLLSNTAAVGFLDTALMAPVAKPASRSEVHDFELPRPDRWTSLAATLALAAFFFLRRIV